MGYAEVFLGTTAFRLSDFYLCNGYASISNSNGKLFCASSYDGEGCWEHVKLIFQHMSKADGKTSVMILIKNRLLNSAFSIEEKMGKCYFISSTFSCFHKTALKNNY